MKTTSFDKKLTSFFCDYIEIPSDFYASREVMRVNAVRACIKYLIEMGVFNNAEELKKIALKEKGIIIPDKYFEYKKSEKKGEETCLL